jgi:hypothetical protein
VSNIALFLQVVCSEVTCLLVLVHCNSKLVWTSISCVCSDFSCLARVPRFQDVYVGRFSILEAGGVVLLCVLV